MPCLVDLDGVLADFVPSAILRHGLPVPSAWSVGVGTVRELLGLDHHAFWAAIDEQFWIELAPTAECFDLLGLLERYFGAENVCILSSPSRDPTALAGKYRWILRHLPAYNRRYLIGPAKHFCAGPGAVLVDDTDEVLHRFVSAGGQGVLVPRPWNSGHTVPAGEVLAEVEGQLRVLRST